MKNIVICRSFVEITGLVDEFFNLPQVKDLNTVFWSRNFSDLMIKERLRDNCLVSSVVGHWLCSAIFEITDNQGWLMGYVVIMFPFKEGNEKKLVVVYASDEIKDEKIVEVVDRVTKLISV